jgi:hypothetical protein
MGASDDFVTGPGEGSLARRAPRRRADRSLAALRGGGPAGNEHLTTVTGAILIVLLAVIGFTIPQLTQFAWLHLFVGYVLLGPVALKMASTGYRFVRYYTGNVAYRRKGPPELPMRLIAPIVVVSTVAVFITGIVLMFEGPGHRDPWMELHKVSFIVWVVFVSLHVLGHLPAVGRALGIGGGERTRADVLGSSAGSTGRWIALASAVVAGVVLAILLIPDFSTWTASGGFHHHA